MCEELDLTLNVNKYSAALQKSIEKRAKPEGRAVITGSHKELFRIITEMFDKGQLLPEEEHNIDALGEYIFRTFDVRREKNPKEPMKLDSIQSELYQYHERNNR